MAEVIIVDSAEAAGRLVSDQFAEQVQITPEFILGVATGSTPLPVYLAVAQRGERGIDLQLLGIGAAASRLEHADYYWWAQDHKPAWQGI